MKAVREDKYLNMRLGHLVITKLDHVDDSEVYWCAHCDCGRDIVLAQHKIRYYRNPKRVSVPSCGKCQLFQWSHLDSPRILPDGSVDSRYAVWDYLRSRHQTGDVKLDSDWFDCNNFVLWAELFFDWTDPYVSYALHRYDSLKDYTPENCFLVKGTPDKAGNYGTRKARLYYIGTESHTIPEWAELRQVPATLLYSTISSNPSWPFSRVIHKAEQVTQHKRRAAERLAKAEQRQLDQEAKLKKKRQRLRARRNKMQIRQQYEQSYIGEHGLLKEEAQPAQRLTPRSSFTVSLPAGLKTSSSTQSTRPTSKRKGVASASFHVIMPPKLQNPN